MFVYFFVPALKVKFSGCRDGKNFLYMVKTTNFSLGTFRFVYVLFGRFGL